MDLEIPLEFVLYNGGELARTGRYSEIATYKVVLGKWKWI
jgi:hypothetical protein